MRVSLAAALIAGLAGGAGAEDRAYGTVDLTGLARESWPLNPAGPQAAMVCNVNGPDGFLSIRAAPGVEAKVMRRLKRLAIVEVDTTRRQGNWVAVLTAYRTHTTEGQRQETRALPVTGWAHDGYLCDFLD